MTQIVPPIIRITPASSRVAWVIAGGLGLAALFVAGDAWHTGSSPPTLYLFIFGLPTAFFVLLALLARTRSLELYRSTLRDTAWNGNRTIDLSGLAGLSLRVSVHGRVVTRQIVFWKIDRREHSQIDITDYPITQIRRLVGQMLVLSPDLNIDRELESYLDLLPRTS
jgi:hypothetical protein